MIQHFFFFILYQLRLLLPEVVVVKVPQDWGQDGLDGAARCGGDEFSQNRFSELTRSFLFRSAQFRGVSEVGRASGARLAVHVVQQRRHDLVLKQKYIDQGQDRIGQVKFFLFS